MKKKIPVYIVWALCVFTICSMITSILLPQYDQKEAEETLGEIYSFSSDWTIIYKDGSTKKTKLPATISRSNTADLTIEHALSKEYAGLSMNLIVRNAAMHVVINGRPIYEGGYFELEDTKTASEAPENSAVSTQEPAESPASASPDIAPPDSSQSGIDPESGDVSPDSQSLTREERQERRTQNLEKRLRRSTKNTIRIESVENLFDIPNLEEDATIRILLEPVSQSRSIIIERAEIAKRDTAVLSRMRGVIYPMLCLLFTLIALTIMLVMDFTRVVSHAGRHGIFRLVFFAADMMLYCSIKTGIFTTFAGNSKFFGSMEEMCFLMMPVLLNVYFDKRFGVHYPKRMNALIWFSTGITMFSLVLHIRGVDKYSIIGILPPASLLISILVMLFTIWNWSKTFRPERKVFFELTSLVSLLIAAISMPVQRYLQISSSSIEQVITTAVTLFFVLLSIQEISVALLEYKQAANAAALDLENRNRELTLAKEDAESAKQDAILANEAKGKFLANMSHEIRTPINAVLGMDEMILRESREKNIRGYAADIFTAGQTLLSLINDILDFSKIESGKMEIVPVDYDISSLIHDLANMTTQRAKAKDLRFEVSVASDIPARFWGDDVRIRQVLTNILTNSVKYTHEGTIWFRVSGVREGAQELLHFEIEDTGIGMKEEDIPKLFAAYERIEENRNRNIEGTGLGMNITTQLLQLMGGTLDVKSVYGKGSRFSVDIRQKIMDETPLGDFDDRISALQESYTYEEAFRAPEAKVLVVDDNSMNRKVFASFLKMTEIQIDEADSGQASIELATANYYDIIFMDHMMPGMDGVEAMHRIKKMDGPCRDTPIFVLTANAITGAKEEYLKEGFDGFLSKPVAAKKLEDAIRNTLDASLLLPAKEHPADLDDPVSTTTQEPPDDLPTVDGLDWNIAYLHLPDTALVSSTLTEFYHLIPVHADKLQSFYEALPDPDALESYRIQVHGMKSMAATIGIIPLAGMAKMLEYAARDGEEDTIHAMHTIFLHEWRSYTEKLQGVFDIGAEEETEKEAIDPNVLKALFEILQNAMDDFDIDTADETMDQILQYGYEKETLEALKKMKSAVTDLDGDLVSELIKEIIGRLL